MHERHTVLVSLDVEAEFGIEVMHILHVLQLVHFLEVDVVRAEMHQVAVGVKNPPGTLRPVVHQVLRPVVVVAGIGYVFAQGVIGPDFRDGIVPVKIVESVGAVGVQLLIELDGFFQALHIERTGGGFFCHDVRFLVCPKISIRGENRKTFGAFSAARRKDCSCEDRHFVRKAYLCADE